MEPYRWRKEPHEWAGIEPWLWPKVARLLPPAKKTPYLKARRKGGRPAAEDRAAFSAILWLVRSGGTWSRLPGRFGGARTARRRLARWFRTGRLEWAWRAYLYQLGRPELERWALCFKAGGLRHQTLWRFSLESLFRCEFASYLRREASRGAPGSAAGRPGRRRPQR